MKTIGKLGAVALACALTACLTGNTTAFRLGDAVVVTAKETDDAGELATAAADLTNAVFKATGKLLPIYAEATLDAQPATLGSQRPQIHLGATAAAKAAGVTGEGMRNGDWRVKTEPGRAYLYGKTARSVNFAVVEFAERVCDVWMVALDGHDVFLKQLYIPADGLAVNPNWYDLWISERFTDENVFVDRLVLRRVAPPQKK